MTCSSRSRSVSINRSGVERSPQERASFCSDGAELAKTGQFGRSSDGSRSGNGYPEPLRAHSSAGERSLHTREVPGSIPGAPIRKGTQIGAFLGSRICNSPPKLWGARFMRGSAPHEQIACLEVFVHGCLVGVEGLSRCADREKAMGVDYRLLARFEASRDHHEAARRALPRQWRVDPRPEVQHVNDLWVRAFVRVREHQERIAADLRDGSLVWLSDDR